MKIQIDENLDLDDKKKISLLENNLGFEKDIKKIRNELGIPSEGLIEEEIEFTGNFMVSKKGGRVELSVSFPKSHSDKYYDLLDVFINDPADVLKDGKQFRAKIIKICDKYKLGFRWYHAVCHIVLFSFVDWLPNAISAEFFANTWEPLGNKKPGIVINVTKPISKRQFRKWIDKNWDSYLQQLSEEKIEAQKDLPKELYLEVDRRIAELRDKEKLSFPEIADRLTSEYANLEANHPLSNLVVSVGAVDMRYRRFKRRTLT